MAYIKIYQLETNKTALGYEYVCESNSHLDYKVVAPSSGTYYKIFKSNELVAEANWGNILLEGQKLLKRKNGAEWVVSEQPEKYITLEEAREYSVNGKAAASVSAGGHLFSVLYKLITEGKWLGFKPYLQIDYDETLLPPLYALALLVTELSESNSS